jgi:hypothetical protein
VKRTEVTYGQLDRVLKSLGFSCRLLADDPPAKLYEHKASGAYLTVPPFPDGDNVLDYHLAAARITLDNFGIADAGIFAKELLKAG